MLLDTEDFVDLGLSAAAAKHFKKSNQNFEIDRLIFNCQQILILRSTYVDKLRD